MEFIINAFRPTKQYWRLPAQARDLEEDPLDVAFRGALGTDLYVDKKCEEGWASYRILQQELAFSRHPLAAERKSLNDQFKMFTEEDQIKFGKQHEELGKNANRTLKLGFTTKRAFKYSNSAHKVWMTYALSAVRAESGSKLQAAWAHYMNLRSEDSPSSYEDTDTRAALEAADCIVNEAEKVRANYLRTMSDPLDTLLLNLGLGASKMGLDGSPVTMAQAKEYGRNATEYLMAVRGAYGVFKPSSDPVEPTKQPTGGQST